MITALERRLIYFQKITGTTVSDNGIPDFTWVDATEEEIEFIFQKALRGEKLTKKEDDQYRVRFFMKWESCIVYMIMLCSFISVHIWMQTENM